MDEATPSTKLETFYGVLTLIGLGAAVVGVVFLLIVFSDAHRGDCQDVNMPNGQVQVCQNDTGTTYTDGVTGRESTVTQP